ncbi:carbohydrate kinase [Agromyces atrinae]|uniref:carbohydrate kinase family protein n=1 Tax=Agromyces atrinae TaxID=592376 RepID=UPI001F5A634C|nr:carbohydrate kinase [Agromyces atrinae]MCI2959497.1 carbohydrate kinase [Agromyces atrinae]
MSAGEPAIVVIGEALVDIVHRGDVSDESPGGSPANVALTLGRLGHGPRLVTRLGRDERGDAVRSWLGAAGVTVDAVDAPRTSSATARLDAHGAATYEFDIDWDLGGAEIGEADVVHVGSIAALLDPGARDVAELVTSRRGAATITYDPNIRPSLVPDRDTARARVEGLVDLADVVKASDEDLAWLYPDVDPVDAARVWLARGPALVVVTRGSSGVVAVIRSGAIELPAVAADVVDTVGAGDTFMGALIDGVIAAGLAGAEQRTDLRNIAPDALVAILRFAARAAAITVSRPGADPPTRTELTTDFSRPHAAASTKG